MRQNCTVSFGQSAADQTIANEAAVNEQVLRIARGAPIARRGHVTAHTHNLSVPTVNLEQVLEKLRAKSLIGALAKIFGQRGAQDLAAIVRERETNLGMGQRVVSNQVGEVKTFSRFRAQELSPRRHIKE